MVEGFAPRRRRGGSVKIQVNGEPRTAPAGTTVRDLLRELAIQPDRVAVELNYEIVDREEFGQRGLREGDRVEILGFIGGGVEESTKENYRDPLPSSEQWVPLNHQMGAGHDER